MGGEATSPQCITQGKISERIKMYINPHLNIYAHTVFIYTYCNTYPFNSHTIDIKYYISSGQISWPNSILHKSSPKDPKDINNNKVILFISLENEYIFALIILVWFILWE